MFKLLKQSGLQMDLQGIAAMDMARNSAKVLGWQAAVSTSALYMSPGNEQRSSLSTKGGSVEQCDSSSVAGAAYVASDTRETPT